MNSPIIDTATITPILVFQPIVDLQNGSVIGYEALSRLAGKEDEGFQALEQEARRQGVFQNVLKEAQSLAIQIGQNRPPGTLLFLNVTDFGLRTLQKQTYSSQQYLKDIVLELPEHSAKEVNWASLVAPLRSAGFEIAIDDWGVGEADPLRMIRLKPHWLKIDRSLVMQVGIDPDVDRLIEVLVQWTDDRAVKIIAEGCETQEQIDRLRILGIRYAQGFGLARPSQQWITRVALPALGGRLDELYGVPLALAHSVAITEQHMAVVESEQELLSEIIDKAVTFLVKWINQTAIGVHIDSSEVIERYKQTIQNHFKQLMRGNLGLKDIDRATALAQTHLRLGLDMSWYVVSYRELQAYMAQMLRNKKKIKLAEAIRSILGWDMAMTMAAYQYALDRDSLTAVLTRRTFWNRAQYLIRKGLPNNHSWVFTIMDIEKFRKVNQRDGQLAGDALLQQIGHVLQEFISPHFLAGRLGGDEFVLFFPYQGISKLEQTLQSIKKTVKAQVKGVQFRFGSAILGQNGTTLEALYQSAANELQKVHNKTANRA